MPVDYDLLVIGNTEPGRYAAWWASRYFARVALITQNDAMSGSPMLEWERGAARSLIAQGVDVIEAVGAFQSNVGRRGSRWSGKGQSLNFATADRVLTARNALLAMAAQPRIPDIPGWDQLSDLFSDLLTPVGAGTVFSTGQLQPVAGQRIGILGADPAGLEAAMTLRSQGAAVVIWTDRASLLPAEDTELVHHLQAQYEAFGIELQTGCQIQRIRPQAEGMQVEAVNLADPAQKMTMGVNQLVWASPRSVDFTSLNLGVLGLDPELDLGLEAGARIPVRPTLQTPNPQVWICGDYLGGYASPEIGVYEAKIAVENGLFHRQRSVDYGAIPWQLGALMPLARVGLTEAQAQRRYFDQYQVMRFSWPCVQSIPGAVGSEGLDLTAFCKLIVHDQGLLLGAHVISPQSAELIVPLTQAIQHKIPLVAIANTVAIASSEFEQVRQGIIAGLMHQRSQDLRQRDRWEQFFWRQRSG